MTALTSIKNIGPAFEKSLTAAGITTAEQLRELGADAAYRRLLENGGRPHFISYYVLHMALQGRPWNDCKGDEKKALRQSFDQIKESSFDAEHSELERFLNQIGVIARD
ncbi:competence protein TfoX [Loktanella sp. D2R18]|uniref:TfoX/Sxy family protein n=1 Tax=Rhodobacterales TaxID=204455 RepID=UPI000DEBE140|nr:MULTISPECIES: TfoX/Sxy family protein [Rhodobacterales]MDO6589612.1 TfoX/Sxy family protein [Yoonia sp. 1_MG-2023]RBW44248.1 competence protein TfoX [Loktanella sp. D2R18]